MVKKEILKRTVVVSMTLLLAGMFTGCSEEADVTGDTSTEKIVSMSSEEIEEESTEASTEDIESSVESSEEETNQEESSNEDTTVAEGSDEEMVADNGVSDSADVVETTPAPTQPVQQVVTPVVTQPATQPQVVETTPAPTQPVQQVVTPVETKPVATQPATQPQVVETTPVQTQPATQPQVVETKPVETQPQTQPATQPQTKPVETQPQTQPATQPAPTQPARDEYAEGVQALREKYKDYPYILKYIDDMSSSSRHCSLADIDWMCRDIYDDIEVIGCIDKYGNVIDQGIEGEWVQGVTGG